jgi:hypothetical protein
MVSTRGSTAIAGGGPMFSCEVISSIGGFSSLSLISCS